MQSKLRLLPLVALVPLLLAGCSAQVSGMQSPALHDYGALEWVPVDREIQQSLIVGTGYSAAIENDQTTTPEELVARLAALPEDATSGELIELRLPLRLSEGPDGAWDSGATIQVRREPARSTSRMQLQMQEFDLDLLPRVGESVVLDGLGPSEAGDVLIVSLKPGDGTQHELLEVAVTPHRAPYAGWRAQTDDGPLSGALVFETRYKRDVAPGAIVETGIERMSSAWGFITVWAVATVALMTAIGLIGTRRGREVHGR